MFWIVQEKVEACQEFWVICSIQLMFTSPTNDKDLVLYTFLVINKGTVNLSMAGA